MKKIAVLVILLLTVCTVFSQRTIKGRVVNAATGESLTGASVFISNTSVGTTTDNSGFFILSNVPVGRHELIASSIGYETNVFSFSDEQLPLQLRIEMTVKVKELDNVVVEPWVEEGWDKWGKLFLEGFIGRTPNARQCSIKNQKAIRFRFYKRSNRLVAYCDEPLIIENKALGYNLRYQLEDFQVGFKDHSLSFSGYPLFEEMEKDRKGVRPRWQAARDKAYYGSVMHFLRSVYSDSVRESGYDVRRMVRLPNTEKERVKEIYKGLKQSSGEVTVIISPRNRFSKDSADYYDRILRQKDYVELYGKDLLTADSLIVQTEGKYKVIFFANYLYVTYNKEKEPQEYLVSQGEGDRQPFFQRSYIWLVSQTPVIIDVNGGYYPPQEIFAMAYWAWGEKISDLLPQDYAPYRE